MKGGHEETEGEERKPRARKRIRREGGEGGTGIAWNNNINMKHRSGAT